MENLDFALLLVCLVPMFLFALIAIIMYRKFFIKTGKAGVQFSITELYSLTIALLPVIASISIMMRIELETKVFGIVYITIVSACVVLGALIGKLHYETKSFNKVYSMPKATIHILAGASLAYLAYICDYVVIVLNF